MKAAWSQPQPSPALEASCDSEPAVSLMEAVSIRFMHPCQAKGSSNWSSEKMWTVCEPRKSSTEHDYVILCPFSEIKSMRALWWDAGWRWFLSCLGGRRCKRAPFYNHFKTRLVDKAQYHPALLTKLLWQSLAQIRAGSWIFTTKSSSDPAVCKGSNAVWSLGAYGVPSQGR